MKTHRGKEGPLPKGLTETDSAGATEEGPQGEVWERATTDEIYRGLLRDMRKSAGLTQADVAREMGGPRSFVSRYELGERRLDGQELLTLCRICGWGLTLFGAVLEEQVHEVGGMLSRLGPKALASTDQAHADRILDGLNRLTRRGKDVDRARAVHTTLLVMVWYGPLMKKDLVVYLTDPSPAVRDLAFRFLEYAE